MAPSPNFRACLSHTADGKSFWSTSHKLWHWTNTDGFNWKLHPRHQTTNPTQFDNRLRTAIVPHGQRNPRLLFGTYARMRQLCLCRMFGSHGIYCDGFFIGILWKEQHCLKASQESEPEFIKAGSCKFEYCKKGKTASLRFYTAPLNPMEPADEMRKWTRLAMSPALKSQSANPASPKLHSSII